LGCVVLRLDETWFGGAFVPRLRHGFRVHHAGGL
jgi:hypothetical protein